MTETFGIERKEHPPKSVLISGFPGIGKSTLFNTAGELKFLDSDSTNFSWKDKEKQERNPEWPKNYLDHIASNIDKNDAVFISTHKEVRDALTAAGIPFTLVYPSLEMKEEYIQRYLDRGNNPQFVELLKQHYETWITELMAQKGCTHVVLGQGQYLSDVMAQIRG